MVMAERPTPPEAQDFVIEKAPVVSSLNQPLIEEQKVTLAPEFGAGIKGIIYRREEIRHSLYDPIEVSANPQK